MTCSIAKDPLPRLRIRSTSCVLPFCARVCVLTLVACASFAAREVRRKLTEFYSVYDVRFPSADETRRND